MAKIRWATQRHPNGRPKDNEDKNRNGGLTKRLSVLSRLSRSSGSSSQHQTADIEGTGANFGGLNQEAVQAPEEDQEPEREASRRIYFNRPLPQDLLDEDGHPIASYPRNKIRTAKYTPLSFIPKNLWYQFHNIANIYFLVLVILQIFSIFGTTNPGLGAVPLIVIVAITAVKDAIEDWRRTVLDNELNNTRTYTLHAWHNVNVTDEHIGLWRRIKKGTSRLIRAMHNKRKGVSDPYELDRVGTGVSRPSGDYRRSHDIRPSSDGLPPQSPFADHNGYTNPNGYLEAKTEGNGHIRRDFGSIVDPYKQVPGKAKFKNTQWKNVRVGDIVRLRDDDPVPADVVILATSEEDGACYVETKNLDGETNLKIRHGLRAGTSIRTAAQCEAADFWIECEAPHANLYSFSGVARWIARDPDSQDPDAGEEMAEPISIDSMLLRGCNLRNTDWIIGVVVFTGDETRIMMNAGVTPSKRSRLARELNWNVIANFLILFVMCLVAGIINGVTYRDRAESSDYFEYGSIAGSPAKNGIVTFWTCIILFQNLVPISLYISIEIIKTAQAYFIYSDIDMYYEKLDYPCTPKSWNISDDLGQIEYIFSDKTGTLTQNVMEFKKCTINGVPYGEAYTEAMAGMQKRQGINVEEESAKATARIAVDRTVMLKDLRLLSDNPYLDEDKLTFVSSHFAKDMQGASGATQAKACYDFFLALSLCHSVLPSKLSDDPPRFDFKAQSPDEAALVAAARDVGFTVVERTQTGIIVDVQGEKESFEMLTMLEFNSQRKRMSAIYRMPDGRIMLFCKGADSIIYSRLAANQQGDLRAKTLTDLEAFANEGLRTLCIAQRELSPEYYEKWAKQYEIAAASLYDREEKIEECSDEIEHDLVLLGGTAIEDRLQDGVPEAIAMLAEGGIKLWVLTGDKVETAINIGFSCNLLGNDMKLIVFKAPEGDDVEKAETQLHEHLQSNFGLSGSDEELAAARLDHNPPAATHALVIDGDGLKLVLEEPLKSKFLLLCKQCKAVLCCRVSPSQKALVVNMVKVGLNVMTLSIGDGANDVAMIQEADVGVGIAGEEGRQAVMSADYAIGQFRFLSKLVLVHGRWSYRRIAEMIANFFYKNIVWTFTLFWYQIFNNFDGSYLFDYTYILLYNLAFTSLPVIFMGIFDKDVSAKTSMHVPQLYRRGILRLEWSSRKFWLYMIDGLYQSVILFFFAYLLFYTGRSVTFNGNDLGGRIDIGVYVAGPAIFVADTYVMLNSYNWDWLYVLIWLFSVLLFWTWTGIYSQFEYNLWFYKIAAHVFGNLVWWLLFLLVVVVCLLPRFTLNSFEAIFTPTDVDIIREKEHYGEFKHLEDTDDAAMRAVQEHEIGVATQQSGLASAGGSMQSIHKSNFSPRYDREDEHPIVQESDQSAWQKRNSACGKNSYLIRRLD
ncbi:phospholipid-translocating P-type ATPase domain-containing protein [Saitoella complicata NRRL Y-17804]|uniref:phospholipid-translocating P-type ATPase domain-containing protein n=1 Tax=Saitoella complicata (strain BCRC 22490 / CBS 7301 / JCM 7358 / NBRC 10748 / NRRL Y-17804) TaxID=698492 RepID=UPI000867E0DC|nr:phospholipid-translocating P-type ATPase domain-containing protein [Saitoella complicata NRRL Y-17804]ODQ56229.1 phospholipid-translocating P-type ATPase domain-containing protein [Saitoella complicata NRRL Y-17804]